MQCFRPRDALRPSRHRRTVCGLLWVVYAAASVVLVYTSPYALSMIT